jgi:hypothetical protein
MSSVSFWGLHGPLALILIGGALSGALAGTFAGVRAVLRVTRKVSRTLDKFLGDDEAGTGGVLARLDSQDVALAHLLHEIPPNGVPLRADVDAIKEAVELIQAAQKVTDMNVADLRKTQRRHGQDHRRMEAHWIAALRAQGIDTPEPRP